MLDSLSTFKFLCYSRDINLNWIFFHTYYSAIFSWIILLPLHLHPIPQHSLKNSYKQRKAVITGFKNGAQKNKPALLEYLEKHFHFDDARRTVDYTGLHSVLGNLGKKSHDTHGASADERSALIAKETSTITVKSDENSAVFHDYRRIFSEFKAFSNQIQYIFDHFVRMDKMVVDKILHHPSHQYSVESTSPRRDRRPCVTSSSRYSSAVLFGTRR